MVEFISTGYQVTAIAKDVVNGNIKDRLHPSVYGVGFIGVGKCAAIVDGKSQKSYKVWQSMLQRCYCPIYLSKKPTYIGCSVDVIWHNYQNFASWFEENYIDGLQLDKDIKIDGNKVYSSDSCMFVTAKENSEKANAKMYVFNSPKGDRVEIYNLADFCRDNKLSRPNMMKVSSGDRRTHKGWTI